MYTPRKWVIEEEKGILFIWTLICIFAMPVKLLATGSSDLLYSPIIGINVNPIAYNPPHFDPPGKVDFYKASGGSFCCMVGYAFDVNYILQDPNAFPPRSTFVKCRVESDTYNNDGWRLCITRSLIPLNLPGKIFNGVI